MVTTQTKSRWFLIVSQLVMNGGSFRNQTCTEMSTALVTQLWSAMGRSFKFICPYPFISLILLTCILYTSIIFARSMYVFGGFSGMLLNDVLVYRPPSCQAFVAEDSCVLAGPGVRCIWSRGRCFSWEPSMANGSLIPDSFCPTKPGEKASQTSAHFICFILYLTIISLVN